MLTIEQLRTEGEEFWTAVERVEMLDILGLPKEDDLEEIYKKYAYLADMETAQHLKKQYDAADGLEKKKLGWLTLYITERIAGAASARYLDDFRAAMVSARIDIPSTGRTIAFREGSGVMQGETNRKIRQEVQDASNAIVGELAPHREMFFKAEAEVAKQVGFENYFDLYNQCKEVDLNGVVALMQPFVDRTDDLYTARMDEYYRKHMSVSLDEAQRHDLMYFLGGHGYDEGFPEENVYPTATRFLEGMGLDLTLGGRAKIDLEKRPNKSPRAFTCPIVIPDDVTMACIPKGGPDGYEMFMHETGHVLHRGNTSKGQVFELKYFGDKTVTEGFSTLFQHMCMNPIWLEEFLGLTDAGEVIEYLALRKLNQVRRYAMKVKFEIELHSTPGFEEKKPLYSRYMKEAVKVDYPADMYVIDQDQGFYSASYARAWAFAAQLEHYFTETYGEKWWHEKAVGDHLMKWFALGQEKNGDELAQEIGFDGVDAAFLEKKIMGILG